MSAAKLPAEAREPAPRLISTLAPGESGFLLFNALRVAENGDCFLSENAALLPGGGSLAIGVRRDAEGFHVVLPPNRKYTPGDAFYEPGKGAIPVASVRIGGGEGEEEGGVR